MTALLRVQERFQSRILTLWASDHLNPLSQGSNHERSLYGRQIMSHFVGVTLWASDYLTLWASDYGRQILYGRQISGLQISMHIDAHRCTSMYQPHPTPKPKPFSLGLMP